MNRVTLMGRLGQDWSQRAGRRAIRELLRIGKDLHVDAQVRVNALSVVTQCCGEDVTHEETRAIGFQVEGMGEE